MFIFKKAENLSVDGVLYIAIWVSYDTYISLFFYFFYLICQQK